MTNNYIEFTEIPTLLKIITIIVLFVASFILELCCKCMVMAVHWIITYKTIKVIKKNTMTNNYKQFTEMPTLVKESILMVYLCFIFIVLCCSYMVKAVQ